MFIRTILPLFLCMSLPAFSSSDCEEGTFFHKLSQLNGRTTIGECTVEIHVCEKRDSSTTFPSSENWLGDIFIKHTNGKSLYLPLFSPESRFPRTSIELRERKDRITYRYQDKIYDPKSGWKEKYQLTIFKRRPRIEVTMKNSRESRRRPIRSLFFPNLSIKCEEQIKHKGN